LAGSDVLRSDKIAVLREDMEVSHEIIEASREMLRQGTRQVSGS